MAFNSSGDRFPAPGISRSITNLGMIDFTKTANEKIDISNENQQSEVFEMSISGGKGKRNQIAKLRIEDGNYVLLKASYIRKGVIGSFATHNYIKLRKQLEADGCFENSDDDLFFILNRDIPFSSPSAAGAVARNSSINGRKEWKTRYGVTLDDYESTF